MAEIAPAGIFLGVPVVGELQKRRAGLLGARHVFLPGEEDQGEATLFALDTAGFHHSQLVAVEVERRVHVADANHRVQIAHSVLPLLW